MIIDHVSLTVEDLKKAKEFYQKALAPLNIGLVMDLAEYKAAGFGNIEGKKPEFWLGQGEKTSPRLHVAFTAANREQVDNFYKAALDAGGKDNGPPGIREHYHPNYYGAFVLDPEGHNIEAVFHGDKSYSG